MTLQINSKGGENREISLDSWHRGLMDISAVQLHLTMRELWLYAGSHPSRSMVKIYDGKNYNAPS